MQTLDADLTPCAANFVALTPLSFLDRSARVYPDKVAVIHGSIRISYRELRERCRRFASMLTRRGVGPGDTVAVMAPNVPALLEAHFAVPMAGAILNAINIRLDAEAVAFILGHSETKLLLADTEFAPVVRRALERLGRALPVVDIDDPQGAGGERLGEVEYEDFLRAGDPAWDGVRPADEWQAITLNYTSGTTGNPKAAVYHHRGAYLNAFASALAFGLSDRSVYLWTLPMFHCNGWSYPWAVTLAGGTHVCLRRLEPRAVFELIRAQQVTHLCGAPIVLNLLLHAPVEDRVPFPQRVEIATGGAAPPSAVIEGMERIGFRVTHLYGLTETYGPATVCVPQPAWGALDTPARARQMARQGVAHQTLEEVCVVHAGSTTPVPADGATIGEVVLRGNTVMKGYAKNPEANREAFAGGWFHSGDLGVMHADGYIEIRDRAKDVIISGGENISSLELEEVLYRHPNILEAAVVAMPHPTWGETPCAFVTPMPRGAPLSEREVIDWCRERLAHFKCPTRVVFGPLPKTSTGKIQKFLLRQQLPAGDAPRR